MLDVQTSRKNRSLSILDFKIQISPTLKFMVVSIKKKNTTKNLFVDFKAVLNYIRNEIKRIHNRCSIGKDKITHIVHFINTLRNNVYPTSIIRYGNNNSWKLHKTSNTYILKLPHFSEIVTKKCAEIFTRKGQRKKK